MPAHEYQLRRHPFFRRQATGRTRRNNSPRSRETLSRATWLRHAVPPSIRDWFRPRTRSRRSNQTAPVPESCRGSCSVDENSHPRTMISMQSYPCWPRADSAYGISLKQGLPPNSRVFLAGRLPASLISWSRPSAIQLQRHIVESIHPNPLDQFVHQKR